MLAPANIQSVAVIGVGGVGGYFGGKLCRLRENGGDVHVSFIARGEHLRAIQDSGLLLSSEKDERDLFAGSMTRMGHELGVDVSRTEAIARILAEQKPAH